MEPDSLGFKFPVVDYSKCIECGKCERTCPFEPGNINPGTPAAYAGICIPSDERLNSSSGGAFVALSNYFLDKDGIVYGADFDNNLTVRHKRAENTIARNRMRGSKYVQSDMEGIINDISEDLSDGKFVLFTGTPCQCAGVNAAIPESKKKNLLTVDIICHGCPSPRVWNDYVDFIKKKYHTDFDYVKFRDKKTVGWKNYTELFYSDKKPFLTNKDFITLFNRDIMLRESCGVCPYSSLDRPSDITIGDFWGYEKYKPELNIDNIGVSLLLINTDKGKEHFAQLSPYFKSEEVDLKYCLQRNLRIPTPINPLRESFIKDFEKKGLVYVMKKYGEFGFINKVKRFNLKVQRKFKKILNITVEK